MKQKQRKNNTLHKTYKELSIQISLDGLSFCIQNSLTEKVERIARFSFENKGLNAETLLQEVQGVITESEELQEPFDSLKVIHTNNLSTFVPLAIFDEEHMANYLKYSIKILSNDFITYDEVRNKEMVNVYIPFVNINNYLLDWHGEFEYEHFSTVLLQYLLNVSVNTQNPKVYIYLLSKTEFQIIVIQQKKLVLYNSFIFSTPEDFIYYLLFTYENLGLDTEKITTTFIGNIAESDFLYQLAYRYIRFVDIFKVSDTTKRLEALNETEILENFVLLNTTH